MACRLASMASTITGHLTQHDAELIARQVPGRSFHMPALRQHLELRVLQLRQLRRLALGQINAEPLPRDRIAVLQPRITHIPLLHPAASDNRWATRPVLAPFFSTSTHMLARARGQLQRQLGHAGSRRCGASRRHWRRWRVGAGPGGRVV